MSKAPQEIYSFEKGKLVLIDPELQLNHKEPFEPPPADTLLLHYPSGELKGESFYRNRRLHGPSTFYSKKGPIVSRSWFLNGKQVGKCFWYYPSGALYSLQRFKEGAWHGLQEYFYEDGTKKTTMQFDQGILIGNVLLYRKDGPLERRCINNHGRTESSKKE